MAVTKETSRLSTLNLNTRLKELRKKKQTDKVKDTITKIERLIERNKAAEEKRVSAMKPGKRKKAILAEKKHGAKIIASMKATAAIVKGKKPTAQQIEKAREKGKKELTTEAKEYRAALKLAFRARPKKAPHAKSIKKFLEAF